MTEHDIQPVSSGVKREGTHSKVLIIGGGDAAVSTVAFLKEQGEIPLWEVTVIDPRMTSRYQSFQTMIGGGIKTPKLHTIPKRYLLPDIVKHLTCSATRVIPEENKVVCDDNSEHTYDILVVAVGIDLRPDKIKGLQEALDDPECPVGSNYWLKYAKKVDKIRKNFNGGTAIFTHPDTRIKCGGAPMKVMFLSCSGWNMSRFFGKKIEYQAKYYTGEEFIFKVPYYEDALLKTMAGYKIQHHTDLNLEEIDAKKREAVFRNLQSGEKLVEHFDFLHVTPSMTPPKFIQESGLDGVDGYVDVHSSTLQHKKFPNIFSLGDCAGLPTSKTASTFNESAYVLTKNLTSFLKGGKPEELYDGYTACPVFVGKKMVVLAEFGYNNKLIPTFSNKPAKPTFFNYALTTLIIPYAWYLVGAPGIRRARHAIRGFRSLWKWPFRKAPDSGPRKNPNEW
jgi:sulfide:quinone oxidoreductase